MNKGFKKDKFVDGFKQLNINIDNVKKYDTPMQQANSFKKVSILKESNVSYSSYVIMNDK